jgi:hypothetical protein
MFHILVSLPFYGFSLVKAIFLVAKGVNCGENVKMSFLLRCFSFAFVMDKTIPVSLCRFILEFCWLLDVFCFSWKVSEVEEENRKTMNLLKPFYENLE